MSAVLDKVEGSLTLAVEGSTTNTASVAGPHQDIDRHVSRVARQIAHLIEPIMTTWPQSNSFPGWCHLVAADDLLLHLTNEAAEWDEERPKPSACDLMLEVQDHLTQAIDAINTSDALDGHDARRILTTEALTRAKAASCWCIDAHARVESETAEQVASGAPPAAPAEPPDAADQLLAQHATVFGGIALQASILLRLVDGACASTDVGELMGAMDAIRIIVASIGSLADGFNGEDQRGNQYGWHLSENISGDVHA